MRTNEPILGTWMRREPQSGISPTAFMAGDESPIGQHVLHKAALLTGEEFTIAHENAEHAGFLLDLDELASHGHQGGRCVVRHEFGPSAISLGRRGLSAHG